MVKGVFKFFFFLIFLQTIACGYHKKPVKILPEIEKRSDRILFIALDGIGYDLMAELKKEGAFKDFGEPVPLIVTFPSATTLSFTGIFQPLHAGRVPGYESRFYSYKDNKIIGGTPADIYKIPINYKTYFDSFRHTMFEKSVMYTFPGVAGQQDLQRIEKLLFFSDKKILMSYLGGTDGAQHVLGRRRMKRFMKFMDRYVSRMKKKYEKERGEKLEIVFFSDHGMHFDHLKMIAKGDIAKKLKEGKFRVASKLLSEKDVVLVDFGLLSSGVVFTQPDQKGKVADLLKEVEGIDLVFWPEDNKIHMLNSQGEEAYFEYLWPKKYRYVVVYGDPLKLLPLLQSHHIKEKEWITDQDWFRLSWNHYYPDPGYRLYTSFHQLVENQASLLFSLKPSYQFGAEVVHTSTYFKFGHKGTHGGLFWGVSAGIVMTDNPKVQLPQAIRYDQLFPLFIPEVTKAYLKPSFSAQDVSDLDKKELKSYCDTPAK